LTNNNVIIAKWGGIFNGRRFPVNLGRKDITSRKTEGYGSTPAGAHKVIGILCGTERLKRPHD